MKPLARIPYQVTPEIARLFVAQVALENGNAAAAYRALFTDAETIATQTLYTRSAALRRQPAAKEAADELGKRAEAALALAAQKYDMSADRVASELAYAAFTQLRDVVDWGVEMVDGKPTTFVRPKLPNAIDARAHAALAKVARRADGAITVELVSKLEALEKLARVKGFIADKSDGDRTNAVQFVIQR